MATISANGDVRIDNLIAQVSNEGQTLDPNMRSYDKSTLNERLAKLSSGACCPQG
ncbi:hypothetical protein PILCRDRAFT_821753 [Piloderma croceum F 1598]|uniref:Uncharacterized protein n=1 Tax=Piloderma croceum (strain F 1598) TaxID=765440 RepID=A0A0C3FNH1_PILCF|nr:hypothetical protein PILCRDRAFT_821753 [Piloderma croceum F 1598]